MLNQNRSCKLQISSFIPLGNFELFKNEFSVCDWEYFTKIKIEINYEYISIILFSNPLYIVIGFLIYKLIQGIYSCISGFFFDPDN